jgi:uncharacterized protein YbaR (Trm112 family)
VFEQTPVIRFKTPKMLCPKCKVKLKVHYTDTRKIYPLHIGAFSAHRTFMYCPVCKKVHPPEEFEEMVPQFSNVGYDVIVFIRQIISCYNIINQGNIKTKIVKIKYTVK